MKNINHSGINNPNYRHGKPKCLDCKKELKHYESKRCPNCYHKFNSGKNCYQWSDKPRYVAVHRWINKKYTIREKCDFCFKIPELSKNGHRTLQWANKDGKYLRDINNYFCLCISCHKKYDLSHNFSDDIKKYTHDNGRNKNPQPIIKAR